MTRHDKPNLNVRFVSIPPLPSAGRDVQFRAQIANEGNGATPAKPDSFEFDIDFKLDGEVFSTKIIETSIAAGQVFVVDAPDQWTAERGQHELEVVVDPDMKLNETTRDDNRSTRVFLVSKEPEEAEPLKDESQDEQVLHVVTMEILGEPINDISRRIPDPIRDAAGQEAIGETAPADQNPTFIFPLWRGLDTEAGIEMSDKATRGGQPIGENRRNFPETFSVDVKVQNIKPVAQDQTGRILQNQDIPSQVNLLYEAEGQRVRMTSTKHGRTVTGRLRRVRLQDSRDFQDAAIVSLSVREESVSEGAAISLADLVVSTDATDAEVGDAPSLVPYWSEGGDRALLRHQRDRDEYAPTSPSKAGEKQCIRVRTALQGAFDAVGNSFGRNADNFQRAAESTGLGLPEASDLAAKIPFAGAAATGAIGLGKAAHATGSFFSDLGSETAEAAKQLNPSGIEKRWIDLGPVEGGGPQESSIVGSFASSKHVQAVKDEILTRIETKQTVTRFPQRGDDYRFVGEGDSRRIEVSGGALARLLPGVEAVRCE